MATNSSTYTCAQRTQYEDSDKSDGTFTVQ